jgi:hypothetical protein
LSTDEGRVAFNLSAGTVSSGIREAVMESKIRRESGYSALNLRSRECWARPGENIKNRNVKIIQVESRCFMKK